MGMATRRADPERVLERESRVGTGHEVRRKQRAQYRDRRGGAAVNDRTQMVQSETNDRRSESRREGLSTRAQKRVLVVGASGFVGRHALSAISAEGHETIAACRRKAALPEAFQATARIGDLRDEDYLSRAFEGIDVVCLTAAWSALHGHAEQSEQLYYRPLAAAIDAAVQAGVRRVVLTSAIHIKNVKASRSGAVRNRLDRVWPHLSNLIRLEEKLKSLRTPHFSSVALRFGTFTGTGGNLGILPVLIPRLRQRLVPYIDGGRHPMPIIDGADVGRAFAAAASAVLPDGFSALEASGAQVPSFARVVDLLYEEFAVPKPAFSVSTGFAFAFARCAEGWANIFRNTPLLTRSIVFLSEPCEVEQKSWSLWGYEPRVSWQDSVRAQVAELMAHQPPIRLVDRLPDPR